MPLLGKSNKFKVDAPKIRVDKVAVERTPTPKPKPKPKPRAALASSSRSSPVSRPSPKPSVRHLSNSPYPSSDERGAARKRKADNGTASSSKRSPASERVTFDNDDSDGEDDGWLSLDTRKRQRTDTSEDRYSNANRTLRSSRAFASRDDGLELVHAAQVASLDLKCVPVMGAQAEDVGIELQYPSLQKREK